MGRRIGSTAISMIYDRYKKVVFPKLLDKPLVPEGNKRKIKDLLKRPWNPYVRRHTTGTYVSKTLKDPVWVNQYMGWFPRAKTHLKYQHYYADDAFDANLATGVLIGPTTGNKKKKGILKTKQCPNCEETNTPESKFCVKCKFVLSFDAFNETLAERENGQEHFLEKLLQTKQNAY